MDCTSLLYVLALQKVPKVGDVTAKKLLRYCGSAQAIFKEKPQVLEKIPGIGTQITSAIKSGNYLTLAEAELEFITQNKIGYWYFEHEQYPNRLKHCIDGPVLLFYKGNMNINANKTISIVGTRKATRYGIETCEALIDTLQYYNPTIISGFAYGIDITAHKAAIKHKLQTIGCLAHGLNKMYPKTHQKYIESTQSKGGFVTDFWSNAPFERTNFLKRNRLIAGLSDATVVIESADKGGSLVTADIANSYNREVFAVPGRINDSQSKGCNNLIKHQMAHVLSQPEDLIYLLNWQLEEAKQPTPKPLVINLSEEQQVVHAFLLKNKTSSLDAITLHCKLHIQKVFSLLLQMELKGVVKPLPGKLFEAI